MVTVCIESRALARSHKLGVSTVLKQRNQREARSESQRSNSHELTRRLIAFPSRRPVTQAVKRKTGRGEVPGYNGANQPTRVQLHDRLATDSELIKSEREHVLPLLISGG